MPLNIFDKGLNVSRADIEAPAYQAPLNEEPGTSDKLEENDEFDEDGLKMDEGEDQDLLDDVSSSKVGLGTGTLISAIRKLPHQAKDNIFDCFLINVSTIIRNNVLQIRDISEIKEKSEADVIKLSEEIAKYHEIMGSVIKHPLAIFYLPEYTFLPPIHMRPLVGNRKIIKDITDLFIKNDNLVKRKRIREQIRRTTVLEIFAGGRNELPYRTIIREIRDVFTLSGLDPRSILTNYLMISHMALDYLFLLQYPRASILESFTGKFLKAKVLGFKVFGTNFVPFNQVTLLAFGDKNLVKPIALRRGKARLIELAKKQSWYIRTPMEIAEFIQHTGEIPAHMLTYLKL